LVTIYDIAKKTGYTAPSISKALNGTGGLSQKTREKILLAAEELGYKPNMAARALTTKRTYLIGVIFEDSNMGRGFEHPLFGGLLNRFRELVEAAGYDIIFLSKNFGTKKNAYAEHSQYRDVDGVLLLNPDSPPEDLTEITKRGIPCVSTNDYIPNICTILSENKKAGREAVAYLVLNGHRKIGFLGAPFSRSSRASIERREGYEEALKKAHIPINPSYTEICKAWHKEAGYEGAKMLLERNKDLTAIFCANDTIAFGVMQYCKDKDIILPDELSLVGFDDDRVASYTTPALTTFQQNKEVIAEMAADALLQAIAGIPNPDFIRVPAKMIIRDSVKKIL
jgi:LacI family transcriptional regulator